MKEDLISSETKKKRSRRIIYSSNDVDESSIQNTNAKSSRTMHKILHWNIDSVNLETLLRHIENMPSINSLMYQIGAVNTFFQYLVEDEQPSSISYIRTSHPKVWYVVPCSFKLTFETFVAEHLLQSEFLNSHHGGVKQILGTNNIFFNPLMLKKRCQNTKISRIVPRSNLFVLFGPRVFHGRLNVGYNVA